MAITQPRGETGKSFIRGLDWPLLAVFALGPIQWVTLLDVGLSLKPVHLAVASVSLVGLLRLRSFGKFSAPVSLIVFATSFLVYIWVLAASLLLPTSGADGFNFVLKQGIHAACGIGIAAYVATSDRDRLLRTFLVAPLAAAGCFVVTAQIVLASRGVSLLGTVGLAITTGNPKLLQFAIFLNLFNSPDTLASGDRTAPALRHTALAFIWASVVGSIAAQSVYKLRGTLRVAVISGVALGVAVILLSVSRSLILAGILAGLVFFVAGNLRGGRMSLPRLLLGVLGAVGISVAPIILPGLFSILSQRLTSIESDGRINMYAEGLDEISSAPLWGHGAGYQIASSGGDHQIHNLFLASWLQTGLPGLIVAVSFILALMALGASLVLRSRQAPVLGALAALLALPIFRSQVSGEGGSFTLGEWLCIAIVAGWSVVQSSRVYSNTDSAGVSPKSALMQLGRR